MAQISIHGKARISSLRSGRIVMNKGWGARRKAVVGLARRFRPRMLVRTLRTPVDLWDPRLA
jgi:hypothetical protein